MAISRAILTFLQIQEEHFSVSGERRALSTVNLPL